ncbi:hypothetical protein [Dyadobacter sp. BHUBP1]|uniref:hypothetical protein n=1 Tax=Dyadobacter sp. BHUBP1 TaxID=3424178 RepID=UPI003D340CF8
MGTEIKVEKRNVPDWFTPEKLEEFRPAIEAAAQEKVDRLVAAWTPEFKAALRKLRERKTAPRK